MELEEACNKEPHPGPICGAAHECLKDLKLHNDKVPFLMSRLIYGMSGCDKMWKLHAVLHEKKRKTINKLNANKQHIYIIPNLMFLSV